MGQVPSVPNACQACQGINIDALLNTFHTVGDEYGYCPPGYQHRAGFSFLQASAATCYVCKIILDELVRFSKEDIIPMQGAREDDYLREQTIHLGFESVDDLAQIREPEKLQGAVTILIYHVEEGLDLPVVIGHLGVFVKKSDQLAKRKIVSGRPTSLDPASKKCFELIRSWMDECARKHRWCGNFKDEGPLPTRVIDVGDLDGKSEPYLLESEGRTGQWAALSHSWGQVSQFTTTADTLDQRKKCIPISELPKSFADAVLVCRSLGIRYLWIDSICIIQGSKDDWASEAGKMGYVYRSAHLTISAATAKNSTEGLLTREPPRFNPVTVNYEIKKLGIQGQFFIRPALPLWDTTVDGPQSQLSKRGWIMQERVLSPRTLHYAKHEILWECCSVRTSEGNVSPTYYLGDGIERNWHWAANKTFILPFKAALRQEPPQAPKRFTIRALQTVFPGAYKGSEIRSYHSVQRGRYISQPRIYYLRWYSLVMNYSRRKLTYGSDKLVAMAGLASEFQKFFPGDMYAAGLWKNDILRALLWRTESLTLGTRSTVYRAPSWSWASLDGLILMQQILDIDLVRGSEAEVLHLEMETSGENKYGAVVGGKLVLRGQWKAVDWERVTREFQRLVQHRATLKSSEDASNLVTQICLDDWIVDLDTEWDPSVVSSSSREMGILLIAKGGTAISRDVGIIHGLMVQQIGLQKEEYKRIGRVTLTKGYEGWELRTITIL